MQAAALGEHSQHPVLNQREAVHLWHRVNLLCVQAQEPDLSQRQMAILTIVYLQDGPHTVRGLAQQMGVTKAVITRGLNRLSSLKFIERAADPADKRSVNICRTSAGARHLAAFANRVSSQARALRNVQTVLTQ